MDKYAILLLLLIVGFVVWLLVRAWSSDNKKQSDSSPFDGFDDIDVGDFGDD